MYSYPEERKMEEIKRIFSLKRKRDKEIGEDEALPVKLRLVRPKE